MKISLVLCLMVKIEVSILRGVEVMNVLWSLLLLPPYLRLGAWQIDSTISQIYLTIASMQAVANCPICHEAAHRIHSHYERTLADLPWGEYSVSWQLQVRKFFCTNSNCQRRIFTERLPGEPSRSGG